MLRPVQPHRQSRSSPARPTRALRGAASPVVASGPGAAAFNNVLDNTEVFHNMIDALGIDSTD
jgi:alkaline phosphatase